MAPELRARLRHSIAGHEGLVLRAYDDATGRVIQPGDTVRGWPTIGYGRNLTGRGITQAEADYLLDNDLGENERELLVGSPWIAKLDLARQLVLLEMSYNLGAGNLLRGWPTFLGHVAAQRYDQAAALMLGSKWAGQVKSRALHLARLMQTGAFA